MNIISSNRRVLILLLVAFGFALALIIMARTGGEDNVDSWETDYVPDTVKRQYSLSDAREASHMNVTVYREGERPLYLGWSGGSEEMEAFVEAVAGAIPADGASDETFTDLIVFFFADGDSFAVTYSRDRDLLVFEDEVYTPAVAITSLITAGEERYN